MRGALELVVPPAGREPALARWADFDALGHLHRAAYLTLIEQARLDWLERRVGHRFDHVIVALAIVYRRAIPIGDRALTCSFAVGRVGTTSVTLDEAIGPAGADVPAAVLETTVVVWEPHAQAPRPVTDEERVALTRKGG